MPLPCYFGRKLSLWRTCPISKTHIGLSRDIDISSHIATLMPVLPHCYSITNRHNRQLIATQSPTNRHNRQLIATQSPMCNLYYIAQAPAPALILKYLLL